MTTNHTKCNQKQPEVGDVWEDKFGNRMFVCYSDKTTTAFNVLFRINQGLDKYTVLTKEFMQSYTYLGKSKVNIKELFDVEEK